MRLPCRSPGVQRKFCPPHQRGGQLSLPAPSPPAALVTAIVVVVLSVILVVIVVMLTVVLSVLVRQNEQVALRAFPPWRTSNWGCLRRCEERQIPYSASG